VVSPVMVTNDTNSRELRLHAAMRGDWSHS
jgi:hypothetical protein